MDLPIELRLRIYEIVFEPGRYQELSPRHPSDMVEPGLLSTNRRIRKKLLESSIAKAASALNSQKSTTSADP